VYKTAHFKMKEGLIASNSMHKLSLLALLRSKAWERFALVRIGFEETHRMLGTSRIGSEPIDQSTARGPTLVRRQAMEAFHGHAIASDHRRCRFALRWWRILGPRQGLLVNLRAQA
jgi:hypothetical protein